MKEISAASVCLARISSERLSTSCSFVSPSLTLPSSSVQFSLSWSGMSTVNYSLLLFIIFHRSHELLGGPASHIFTPLFLFSLPMGSFSLVSSMYLTISIRWNYLPFVEPIALDKTNNKMRLSLAKLNAKLNSTQIEVKVEVGIKLDWDESDKAVVFSNENNLSVERYFGICYPIQSRVAGRRRVWLYLIPVIFFSLLYNIPKFLEITPDGNLNSNFSHNLLYDKVSCI